MNEKTEQEKRELLSGAASKPAASGGSSGKAKTWSTEETQLLIKAVNLFPAGTNNRSAVHLILPYFEPSYFYQLNKLKIYKNRFLNILIIVSE